MDVHLVDGTFELFRCFHGAPRATGANGQEVGAARGLLHTFVALLRGPAVTHVAVAFDSIVDRPAPQRGQDAGSLLRSQFPLAADVTRALGLLMWPMSRFQADDALATGAHRYGQETAVERLFICSPDNDFCQCVRGERIVLLDRVRKRIVDEAAVLERFGVPPRTIPEYLALVGDVSDGLPGIPRWGAKSAAAVLRRYPTVEEIPDHVDDWDVEVRGADALARNLRERRREALLYRNLSILRTDVPLPDSLEHLEWKGARREAMEELTDRIGEKEILERIPRWQGN
jgi:5'-3' exonuclease